jgi:hypothetical protein
MGNMGNTGKFENTGNMGNTGKFENMGNMGKFEKIEKFGKIGEVSRNGLDVANLGILNIVDGRRSSSSNMLTRVLSYKEMKNDKNSNLGVGGAIGGMDCGDMI